MFISSHPDAMLSVGQARKVLGVTSRTLREYTLTGRLPDERGPSGRRIFRRGDLDGLRVGRAGASGTANGVLLYARVSSRHQQQEGDLDQQVARLQELALTDEREVRGVFTDVGSGLSDKRSGLTRMLKTMNAPGVSEAWVTTTDRLSRSGTGIIELYAQRAGVSIRECFPDMENARAEDELVTDMLAIMAGFDRRLYGPRSAKARSLRAVIQAEIRGTA